MMHVPSFPYQTNYFGPIGYSFPIFNIHSPAASPNSMACGSGPDPADPVCVQTWPLPVQLGEKAWPVQCRNELRHPGRRTSHAPSAACGSAYVGRAHSVYVRPGSVPWDSKTPKQFARKNRRRNEENTRAAPWWKETIGKRHIPQEIPGIPKKNHFPRQSPRDATIISGGFRKALRRASNIPSHYQGEPQKSRNSSDKCRRHIAAKAQIGLKRI